MHASKSVGQAFATRFPLQSRGRAQTSAQSLARGFQNYTSNIV